MVLRPMKRPTPWSTWTTRSPAARLETSAMKFSARFAALRGRTRRSPRMSCSPMTARPSVSKPGLEPEHGEPDLRLRQGEHRRPVVDGGEIERAVVGEHVAHAVARAVAPQREHDPLAGRLQRVHMGLDRLEHVGVGLRPLRREIAALPVPASSTDAVPSGAANGVRRTSLPPSRRSRHSASAR